MVQGNGNGGVVVNKWLWVGVLSLIGILLSIIGVYGKSSLDDIERLKVSLQANEIVDARQDEKFESIKETLVRMEATLNTLNGRSWK
jgi:hypothetical protein